MVAKSKCSARYVTSKLAAAALLCFSWEARVAGLLFPLSSCSPGGRVCHALLARASEKSLAPCIWRGARPFPNVPS